MEENGVLKLLKEDWKLIRGFLIASASGTGFIVGVAVFGGMVMIKLLAVVCLTLIAWQMHKNTRSGRSALGRVLARCGSLAVTWAAIVYAAQVTASMLTELEASALVVGLVPTSLALILPVWLWGQLFGSGGSVRIAAFVQLFVTTVKVEVAARPLRFDEFDSQPIVLSVGQYAKARRLVWYSIGCLAFVLYLATALLYNLFSTVDSTQSFVVAVSLGVAVGLAYVWTGCALYRMWNLVCSRQGLRSISPWEQFLIYP